MRPQRIGRSVSVTRSMLSVILPTYNERDNVTHIINDIVALLTIHKIPHEIIVVDDNSPDLTWKMVEKMRIHYPHLRVIRRMRARGLNGAIVRGWQLARGEYLGVLDADGQHPVTILPELYRCIATPESDIDIAIASRHTNGGKVENVSPWRSFVSVLGRLYGRIILPDVLRKIGDPLSGCFIARRSVLRGVSLQPQGFKILVEILATVKTKAVAEIGYIFRARHIGKSKATLVQAIQYIMQILRLRVTIFARQIRVLYWYATGKKRPKRGSKRGSSDRSTH